MNNHIFVKYRNLSPRLIEQIREKVNDQVLIDMKFGKVCLYSPSKQHSRRTIGIISDIDLSEKSITIFTTEIVSYDILYAGEDDIIIC